MSATDRMTARQESEHDPEKDPLRPEALRRRYDRLRSQRSNWEALWQDCYDYSLPARRPNTAGGSNAASSAGRVAERLFDATAADAAEQLAATLLAQLTPPWSRWFAFQPGRDIPEEQHGAVSAELDKAAELLQAQFDRSNLSVGWRAIQIARNCSPSPPRTGSSRWRWTWRRRRWPGISPITPSARHIITWLRSRRPGPRAIRPAR